MSHAYLSKRIYKTATVIYFKKCPKKQLEAHFLLLVAHLKHKMRVQYFFGFPYFCQ